jgi:hypothetical protein
MSWTAWLLLAAVGIGVFASLIFLELLHVPGKLLDRLPPQLGMLMLGVVIVVCTLAGLATMPRR